MVRGHFYACLKTTEFEFEDNYSAAYLGLHTSGHLIWKESEIN